MQELGIILIGLLIVFVITLIAKGLVIVKQSQVMIIENFGKYSR